MGTWPGLSGCIPAGELSEVNIEKILLGDLELNDGNWKFETNKILCLSKLRKCDQHD